MIVCTCDHCGKETKGWTTLRIDFLGSELIQEHREICGECQAEIRERCLTFLNEITLRGEQND